MIEVTESVYWRLVKLLKEANDDSIEGLRIFVQGGGCSGFQYGFRFADAIEEGDEVYEDETTGVKVIVDPVSMQYLDGAVVDFVKTIEGEHFSIKNPNATSKCGCGSSFGA